MISQSMATRFFKDMNIWGNNILTKFSFKIDLTHKINLNVLLYEQRGPI